MEVDAINGLPFTLEHRGQFLDGTASNLAFNSIRSNVQSYANLFVHSELLFLSSNRGTFQTTTIAGGGKQLGTLEFFYVARLNIIL